MSAVTSGDLVSTHFSHVVREDSLEHILRMENFLEFLLCFIYER